jgi:hypothetical protein
MWIFVVIVGLVGGGIWIWERSHHAPAPQPKQQLPPAAPAPPDASSFTTLEVNGTPVASFLAGTRDAMVAILRTNGWTVHDLISSLSGSSFTMGPGGAAGSANALVAIQSATLSGLNVWMDADAALKLAGSPAAPAVASSPVFVTVSPDVPSSVQLGDVAQEIAKTPQQAVEALDPNFPGSRFVLFARAQERFT